MEERQDFLVPKYCAACFEPLDGEFDGVCTVCGQKTAAININKRLKLDETVDKEYRNAPKKAAAIFGAAGIIQLVYSLILLFILLGLINDPFKSNTTTINVNTALNAEVSEGSDAYYIKKALKCDTYADFLESCKPLTREDSFYRRIWKSAVDISINRGNSHNAPQDPIPLKEADNSVGSTILMIGGGVGIFALSLVIPMSFITVLRCVGALRDRDGSLHSLSKWGETLGQFSIITLNFITVGLCVWGLMFLDKLNISLGGTKMRVLRYKKIHKAKNPLGDTNEWCCGFCGYINEKRDSECKSCGKYR